MKFQLLTVKDKASIIPGKFLKFFSLAVILLLFNPKVFTQTETLTTGSYIINMGLHANERATDIQRQLKPYGLVYDLVENYNVPVRWVIGQDKAKDGTDFSYNGVVYRGGTFIIPKEFITVTVAARIAYWNGQGVVGVYTTSSLTVNVFLTLKTMPNWTFDLQNGSIATGFFINAGIPVSTDSDDWLLPSELGPCNDIFVMPHADPEWETHSNLYFWNQDYRGAIWAGCHAVSALEGMYNPADKSQQTNFLANKTGNYTGTSAYADNALVLWGNHGNGSPPYITTNNSANDSKPWGPAGPWLVAPDDPVAQYMGIADLSMLNGSEQIFMPVLNNQWREKTRIISYDPTQADVPVKSPGPASLILYGRGFGEDDNGWVMYQAAHSINKGTVGDVPSQRAFFNWSFLAVQDKVPTITNVTGITPNGLYPTNPFPQEYPMSVTFSSPVGASLTNVIWSCTCPLDGSPVGTFTPNNSPSAVNTVFVPPVVEQERPLVITVEVFDQCGRSTFESYSITLLPGPRPPVAVDDFVLIEGDCVVPGTNVNIPVLDNDSDPDGGVLTVSLVNPSNPEEFGNTYTTVDGTWTTNGTTVTFEPVGNFFGTTAIAYRVCDNTPAGAPDNGPLCDQAFISVSIGGADGNGCLPGTVYGVSDEVGASAQTNNSVPTAANALGLPDYDSEDNTTYAVIDNNSDWLLLDYGSTIVGKDSIAVYFASGTDGVNVTMQVQYSTASGGPFTTLPPAAGSSQVSSSIDGDEVYYEFPVSGLRYLRISRSAGTPNLRVDAAALEVWSCIPAIVEATDDLAFVREDSPVTVNVTNNDRSPGNLPLTVTIVTLPMYGQAKVNVNSTIQYQPDKDSKEDDFLVYQVCNSQGLCNTAILFLSKIADDCNPGFYRPIGSTQGSVVLNPVADSWFKEDSGGDDIQGGGTGATLEVGKKTTKERRAILQFDLSSLPANASIDSAKFRIVRTGGDGDELSLGAYRIMRGPSPGLVAQTWTETQVTWLHRKKSAPTTFWANPGGNIGASPVSVVTSPGANGQRIFDITSLVSYWYNTPSDNFGLVIGHESKTIDKRHQFASRENGTAANRPTLTVYYRTQEPCEAISNYPPMAVNDYTETSSLSSISVSVLANDIDYEGAALTITNPGISITEKGGLRTGAAIGTAIIDPNDPSKILFTPNPTFFESVAIIQYRITDGILTDDAVIYLEVHASPPIANDDAVNLLSNIVSEPTSINIDVKANDTDVQVSPAEFATFPVSIVSGPSNGTVVVDPVTFVVTYTPALSFTGIDSFVYQLCQLEGIGCEEPMCSTATVTVTVLNRPPVANDDTYTIQPCNAVTFNLISNDLDPELGQLTVIILTQPASGSLVNNNDGTVTFTPDPDSPELVTFTYQVQDVNLALSNPATVTINIPAPVPHDPVAVDDEYQMWINELLYFDILENDYDPENSPLTLPEITAGFNSVSTGLDPSGSFEVTYYNMDNGRAFILSNGSLGFEPNDGFFGTVTLTYEICNIDIDPISCINVPSGCDQALVTIFVKKGELSVEKTADTPLFDQVGQVITYTIVTSNTGNILLEDVIISDPMLTAINCSWENVEGVLEPGETVTCVGTYTVAQEDIDAGKILNTAQAVGKYFYNGGSNFIIISGSDDETVEADQQPAITILKTATSVTDALGNLRNDGKYQEVGDIIYYELAIENQGNVTLYDVTVVDPLTGLNLNIGTLAPDANGVVTTSYTITHPDLVFGSVANTGTVTGTYTDKNNVPQSTGDTDNELVFSSGADLEITKTVNNPTPDVGENAIFTIVVTNNGPSSATGVVATDALPGGYTLVNAVPTVGSWSSPAWNIGNLAFGASATLTVTATVNEPGSGSYLNMASVTGNETDPVPGNNQDEEETTPLQANLSINKTDAPDPVFAGNAITYTITVNNAGPDAAVGVVVNDVAPVSVLSPTFSIDGGVSWNPWTGSYNYPGSLSSGNNFIILIRGTVNPNLPQASVIENTATVTSTTTYDPDPDDNTSSTTTVVNTSADLQITKVEDNDPVIAGEVLTYTIEVTNLGPSDALAVQVADNVPVSLQNVAYSLDGIIWNPWSTPYVYGMLAAGSSFSFQIRGTVNPNRPHGSSIVNTATVSSSTPDPSNSNNSSTATTTVNREADLEIVKLHIDPAQLPAVVEVDPSLATAGTQIYYLLLVANNGPSYAQNVIIEDIIPVSVSNPQYSLNFGNSWFDWGGTRILADFEYPGTNEVLIRGTISSDYVGTLTNTATVESDTFDPDQSNNSSTVITTVGQSADLAIFKEELISPLRIGGEAEYLITVVNLGPSVANNLIITDVIDEKIISDALYFDGVGWVTWTGSVNISTLAYGATATLTIVGNVMDAGVGTITNTATVSSDTPDPVPGNNSWTIYTPIGQTADLSILKKGPVSVTAGNVITYEIEVTNNTLTFDAVSVQIIDNINPSSIQGTSYSTDGGVTWVAPWPGSLNIGTLAGGATFKLTIKGTVRPNVILNNLPNTAQVTSSTPDPDLTNNTSSITTPVLREADLKITKLQIDPAILPVDEFNLPDNLQELSIDPMEIIPGETIYYLLVYENMGPSDATNVIITDPLPGVLLNPEASRCQANYGPWTGSANAGTVVAGGTCVVVIRGLVNTDATGVITNTATIASDLPDPVLDNNISTIETLITPYADLQIIKAGSPNPVIAGENINYEITVVNFGPSASQGVRIDDVVPGVVLNPEFSVDNGLSWDPWTGEYIIGTVGTSTNSNTFSLQIRGQVNPSAAEGSQIVNTATVTSTLSFDPNPNNNSSAATNNVTDLTDLKITKVDSPDPVIPGQTLTYTITVENLGPSDAQNVVATDNLPAGLLSANASATAGSWNSPYWNLGTLAAGASQTLTITAVVGELANGAILTNTATVITSTQEVITGNNMSTVTTTITANPQISMTKTADKTSNVVVNETITYTYVVTNTGNVVMNNITVADLHSGFGSLSAITPASIPMLAVGSSATFTATYIVTQEDINAQFDIVNTATATATFAGQSFTASANETVILTTANPSIFLNKFADDITEVVTGQILTYTYEVTNTGNVVMSNVTVADLHSGAGALSNINPASIPSLGIGQTVTFTATYQVTQEDIDLQLDIVNTATATATYNGDDYQDFDAEIVDVKDKEPSILVTKLANPQIYSVLGQPVTYTITVKNTGNVTLNNVIVADPLTGLNTTTLTLSPNEELTYVETYFITLQNLINGTVTNTATAAGEDPQGNPVENEASEIITAVFNDILAEDDNYGPFTGYDGNPNAGNVLDNDEFNGNLATVSEIDISIVIPAVPINGGPVPSIDPLTGNLNIPPQTPAGVYTITYRICEDFNPVNCDEALVSVIVVEAPILAENDNFGFVYGNTGNANIGNVLDNDMLNDLPVDISDVQISIVNPATDPGVSIDINTGILGVAANTPGGLYTITYQICEVLNPANCDDAVVTVFVMYPELTVTKTADPQTYSEVGEAISYTITVKNTGNVILNDVLVTDPLTGLNTTTLTLTPNQELVYTEIYFTTSQDVSNGTVTNTVTANGEDPIGGPVADDATAIIYLDCVAIEAWVYLEGAAISPSGMAVYALPMRTDLNNKHILPGQTFNDFFFGTQYTPAGQPYNAAPWFYFGTEGVGFDSDGIAANGDAGYPSTVVDWVLVSLRDNPKGVGGPVCQAAALLHKDGTIEFVNGSFTCCGLNLNSSYWIVIEHRNHLIVMSHEDVEIVNNKITYDFRNKQSYIDPDVLFPQLFVRQKEVLPGVFAMFGGNGQQSFTSQSDTDINSDDRVFWGGENGIFGYYRIGDFNLNGDVNFNDRTIWEFNNGQFTSVSRD